MVLIKCDRVWEKINWKRKVVHLSAFAVGQHVSASFGKSLLRHFLDRRLAGQVRHGSGKIGREWLRLPELLKYGRLERHTNRRRMTLPVRRMVATLSQLGYTPRCGNTAHRG